MKNKFIGINALLNAIKTIFSIIFPLITFPYISRVLGVENIGIYNFSSSIVSYFTLLAGLGISTYAIREGARYRNDRNKISDFCSEVFSINFISTLVSYVILLFCLIFLNKLHDYISIIVILSISISFTTLGSEWIFNIFEEFGLITIRTIICQFISVVLMFIFVKDRDSLVQYSVITLISTSGANFINIFSRKKYCDIRFCFNSKMRRHLIPILILFANSIAMTIYINSDVTILGLISGSYHVGLYSVATKVYTMLKSLLGALIVVSIPRLSSYIGIGNKREYSETASTILNSLITLAVPVMVGTFALSDKIVFLLSGKDFLPATTSLQILSVALLFSIFSWFYTSCVLIVNKEDKSVLKATTFAALANIILNVLLIPYFNQNAAAFTTALAELISAVVCYLYGRKYFQSNLQKNDIISTLLGSFLIIVICRLVKIYISSLYVSIFVSFMLSVIGYGIVLVLFRNNSLKLILDFVKRK